MSEPNQPSPALPDQCPNCDAPVHGPYCAQCGQETEITALRLRDFSHEYFQHFVTLESRLWRSLWTLIRYPGMLTTEFLAGRRRRYVRPLPLYLSLSFATFLMMGLMSVDLVQMDSTPSSISGAEVSEEADSEPTPAVQKEKTADSDPTARIPPLETLEKNLGLPQWLKPVYRPYYAAAKQWERDPTGHFSRMKAAMTSKIPIAVFVLVPLFALNTRLLYRRRRRFYAEHFLFALHFHAFVFLTLLVKLPIDSDALTPLMFIGWIAYLSIALRRFLGGRLWPQILKAYLLLLGHGLLLVLAMLVTFVLTVPFA